MKNKRFKFAVTMEVFVEARNKDIARKIIEYDPPGVNIIGAYVDWGSYSMKNGGLLGVDLLEEKELDKE